MGHDRRMTSPLKPADILAIRTSGLAADLIQLGEGLSGKPNLSNHIAVMHHWSGDVPWGLEGRPGGVGWRDLRAYIGHPLLLNNCGQPDRSDEARGLVCARAEKMLGTAYDWAAITDDVLRTFGMADLWAQDVDGQAPGHVVCSSYAAFLYGLEKWAAPVVPWQDDEPADWDAFILAGDYNVPLR